MSSTYLKQPLDGKEENVLFVYHKRHHKRKQKKKNVIKTFKRKTQNKLKNIKIKHELFT